jgi:hypothetical protein
VVFHVVFPLIATKPTLVICGKHKISLRGELLLSSNEERGTEIDAKGDECVEEKRNLSPHVTDIQVVYLFDLLVVYVQLPQNWIVSNLHKKRQVNAVVIPSNTLLVILDGSAAKQSICGPFKACQ